MRGLLQDWVTYQADKRPDLIALAMDGETVTYAELESVSNRLAHLLIAQGCKKGDRVCFLMPKSPLAIVCILGILKSDCTYVPIDSNSPAARIQKILDSCESRMLVAAGPIARLLDEIFAEERFRKTLSLGWLDKKQSLAENLQSAFRVDDLQSYSGEPVNQENSGDDTAYILFTSGSTGAPKGVAITHNNVTAFIRWANRYFDLNWSDRISGHSPLHFDLSVFDIFGAFAAGAELHLVPPKTNLLPNKLAEFIRESELTQWFSVPSALNFMAKFDVVQKGDFPKLKRLIWCGEVFPTPALIYWMRRLPHVSFTNLYGPTETTIASSYYTVPSCPQDERAATPIGTACDGEDLLVLDDRLEPVPNGQIGDLYIKGAGLSPGYWRDPDKTDAAFLTLIRNSNVSERIYKTGDLASIGENSLIYFHGRSDSQIKSRGYRIELGDIETALNAIDFLKESAVVAIETDGFEGATICCGYVPLKNSGVTPVVLRKELGALLPSYMLPSQWMSFEKLPKNSNGKIDRKEIKEAFQNSLSESV